MSEPLYCSFCSAEHGTEAQFLVAGPGVFICDQCVDQAAEIVAEQRAKNPQIQQSTNPSE